MRHMNKARHSGLRCDPGYPFRAANLNRGKIEIPTDKQGKMRTYWEVNVKDILGRVITANEVVDYV